MAAWDDVLAALEARVAEVERELPHAQALSPFDTPVVDGPCPPALHDRAEALLARTEAALIALDARTAAMRSELQRLPRARTRREGESRLSYRA